MRKQEVHNFSAQKLKKVAIMSYFSHNTLLCQKFLTLIRAPCNFKS